MEEKSNKIISQDNAITSARYEMSALEKNIIYMMMAQLKKEDTAEIIYYVSVRELMDQTGTRNSYEDLKRATENLIGRVLQIKRPNGNLLQVSMISSAEYLQGQGIIEIGLDPKIRPFFFDLKQNFTAFQLHLALSLDSKYSKRIYEMLSQYKDLGTFKIDLLELKRRLLLYDDKTGEEQYRNWSDFEKRILLTAETEINEKTDLNITYAPLKTGRKFTDIVFTIKKSQGTQVKIDFKDESAVVFGRLVNEYRLRKDQAVQVIEKYSVQEINKALYDIRVKMASNEVKNIGAYTAKVFGLS
jgi:plasmid replication initiation protein